MALGTRATIIRAVTRARFALAFCVLVLAGCNRGGDRAPPCNAVGAKFLVLAKDDLEKKQPDQALRRGVEDQLPAMRDSIVFVCTETKWTPAVRTCLVDAKDHAAFEACELQLTDVQRRDLARAAAGEDITKPPAPPK
jgi:hypothetical protein